MSSLLTNYSAMTALQTLRNVNDGLNETQNRVSTGLKVRSGKDNAAYFTISNTMSGDSGMLKAINEGLSLTRNSVATARAGAEQVAEIAEEFAERVAFAQGESIDHAAVKTELQEMVARIDTVIKQSTFNGDDLLNDDDTRTVVTGVTRANGNFAVTTISFKEVDLVADVRTALNTVANAFDDSSLTADLTAAEGALKNAIKHATSLGVAEKSIDVQKDFLSKLVDEIDGGIGGMIDADMEAEAARLQALQVQQQLSTQSLSIANQNPQNILSLFR